MPSNPKQKTESDPGAWLPDCHFGTATTPLPAVGPAPEDDSDDPDDDEMAETPPEVIMMLGFDPLDGDDDADTDEDLPPDQRKAVDANG